MTYFYKLGVHVALSKLGQNPGLQAQAKAPTWDLGGKTPSGFRPATPQSNVGERARVPSPGTGPGTPTVSGTPTPPSPGTSPFTSPVPNIGERDVPNVSPQKPVQVKQNPAPQPKTPSAGGTTDVGGAVAATSGSPV